MWANVQANLPFTLRNITLLTPAPILFLASHKYWPCASLVIFLKFNDPLPYSDTFGSYSKSLYSPGVAPIAFPIIALHFIIRYILFCLFFFSLNSDQSNSQISKFEQNMQNRWLLSTCTKLNGEWIYRLIILSFKTLTPHHDWRRIAACLTVQWKIITGLYAWIFRL